MQIPLKNMPRAAPQNRPIGGITPRSTINTAGRAGRGTPCLPSLARWGILCITAHIIALPALISAERGAVWRGIADDVTDLAATTGIDMVGEDIYYSDWDNIDGYLQPKSADNLTHLAECSTTYDYSNIAGKIFSIGGGFMPYCYRDDRIENSGEGMYANIQAARPVRGG